MSADARVPAADAQSAASVPKRERVRTILLAEDDPEMRRLLCSELRHDGYEVLAACDGTEMLEMLGEMSELAAAGPDVIIMDVRMPGYSGLHVLAALRGARRTTPAILITAFGDRRTHDAAAKLGAVIFDKPFDLDDLRTALLNLERAGRGTLR